MSGSGKQIRDALHADDMPGVSAAAGLTKMLHWTGGLIGA